MKFQQFLIEGTSDGKYKTPITEDEAIELIKTKCTKVNVLEPFWRGMRKQTGSYFKFQGDSGNRLSATLKESGNYYNTILDHYIQDENKNYPLRSKSIICANNANFNHTEHFGNQKFAIFPYDTTIIGYLPKFDIWLCKLQFGNKTIEFLDFNELLSNAGNINSLDYNELINGIKKVISKTFIPSNGLANKATATLRSYFENEDQVESILKKAFNDIDYFFGDASKDDHTEREVWIGGPCIGIEFTKYFNMKGKLK